MNVQIPRSRWQQLDHSMNRKMFEKRLALQQSNFLVDLIHWSGVNSLLN